MTETMRGVFPILVTPFDDEDRLDIDSLQSLVLFLIEAGVHGIGVALGSEILRLTEDERETVTREVVAAASGRAPVVINTSGGGTQQVIAYSRKAEAQGADALMLTAPSFVTPDADGIRSYFKAVSESVHLPIFIQDVNGQHVSASLARQIAEEAEWVRYIKVESSPITVQVAAAVEEGKGHLTVFGGGGGNFFIEEMRRGSQGTMPGCSTPEAFVEVWDLFQQGKEPEAQCAFYERILPVNRLCSQGWGAFYHVHKQILQRRGVIKRAKVRDPVVPLDAWAQRELDELIGRLFG